MLTAAFEEGMQNSAHRRILLHGIYEFLVPIFLLFSIICFFNSLYLLGPPVLLLQQLVMSGDEPLKYSLRPSFSIGNIEGGGWIFYLEYVHVNLTAYGVNTFGVLLDMMFVFCSMMIAKLTDVLTSRMREFDFTSDPATHEDELKSIMNEREKLIKARNDLELLYGLGFLALYVTSAIVGCTTGYQVSRVGKNSIKLCLTQCLNMTLIAIEFYTYMSIKNYNKRVPKMKSYLLSCAIKL